MNIPQEAVEAAMPVMRRHDRCPNDSDCKSCESAVQEIIIAALPAIEKVIRGQVAVEVRQAGRRTSRCRTFEPDACAGCAVRDEVAAFAAKIAEGLRS